MTIKHCKRCGEARDAENDYHSDGLGGKTVTCKICVRAAKRARREKKKAAEDYTPSVGAGPARDLLNIPGLDRLPLTLPPIQSLLGVEITNADDVELKTIDGFKDVLDILHHRMAVSNGTK